MRMDRPERWRSYEKMIEGGLLGGSEGKRDRWCEGRRGGGIQRPATGSDRDGLILQPDD